jgi:hypothetical protein
MKTSFLLTFSVVLSLSFVAQTVLSQEKKTTNVIITGRVYEPAKLPPTIQRIKSLKLPAGFQVHKFAEIQNPRMLTVTPDGTVYVSQRIPGTVTYAQGHERRRRGGRAKGRSGKKNAARHGD